MTLLDRGLPSGFFRLAVPVVAANMRRADRRRF